MTTRPHRTIAPRIAVAALLLLAACGNKRDLRSAKQSIYDADFAVVYNESMQAVSGLYPRFDEDPASGIIKTAWHQVTYSNGGSEDAASTLTPTQPTGGQAGVVGPTQMPGTTNSNQLYKRYFIRFDVAVVGGRPWRVRITGHASEWSPGNAIAAELRGAAIPHWLAGRTDELTVAIYRRLKAYARPAAIAEAAIVNDDEAPIDPSVFGAIPADAAAAAGAIVHAIDVRDPVALRAMVADDVIWSLGAPPGAEAALAMWQADGTALDALAEALRTGCVATSDKVVCPAAASAATFTGWRATLGRRGPGWKLVEFVRGD